MALRRTSTALSQLMPMIMQREMEKWRQNLYLQNKLKGYEAWGQQQKGLQESGMNKEVLLQIIGLLVKGAENLDRPGLLMLQKLLPQAGISPETISGLQLPTPTTTYEEAIDPIQETAKEVQRMYKDIDYTTAENLAEMIYNKGTKFTKKVIEDVAKMKKEQAEMDIREKEFGESVESRKQREKELEVRKGELALDKEGVPAKSKLETRLESKRKERWTLSSKMLGYDVVGKEKENYEKNIIQLNDDIKKLKKQLGYNTPEKDPDAKYAEAAKGLKEAGYTKKDLLEDEKIKAWISENDLNPWILMEYF